MERKQSLRIESSYILRVKTIVDEDFNNYKVPSMLIGTCFCTFKCPKELGLDPSICQNEPLYKQPNVEVPADEIFRRYSGNPITHALVFGGMEPFLQFNEMLEVIKVFRSGECNDDICIYTGYNESEISHQIELLCEFKNIILKVGRFIPNQKPHYDKILGVNLISSNQHAIKIS